VIGIDTNILIYARVATAPLHAKAVAFVEQLNAEPGVVMAELVLVELYMALRNPAILLPPLDAMSAAVECQQFRSHPHWALAENAEVMSAVWQDAAVTGFARRRIIDVRLARTLLAHGVTDFATVNERDFQGLGFARIWNPLV
jgi:toxin-antitoxin system PIN domain toxin